MSLKNTNSLNSNIGKLYLLRGLEFAWFPIPTIIIFYEHHGLSLSEAVMLKTILSFSILLWEIPSGYLADVFGRKISLVAGGIIWSLSWLIYCTQASFTWFAIAEIGTGLAGSLISGADTALAYDTLLELKQETKYRQLEGKLVAIAGISEAGCGIIGAALAGINLVYPFYLQTICIVIYFIIAATLIEPNRSLPSGNINQLKQLKDISFLALVKHQKIKWLIVFSGITSCGTFLIVWLSQEYLKLQEIPLASFGLIWAFFHIIMSFASILAARIETYLGSKKTFYSLTLLMTISYVLLAVINYKWGLIFIATIYIIRGIKTPIIMNYLNQHINSDIRATVISINSFIFRLTFILIAPIIGWIIDIYSFKIALISYGLIFLLITIYAVKKLVNLKVI